MNFDFSDDQKLLRDQARKFLTDKCDRSTVRTVLEDNSNYYSNDLWKSISEMGWTGTAIPEEYGGLGLSNNGCVESEPIEWDGRPFSIVVQMPPQSMSVFRFQDNLL